MRKLTLLLLFALLVTACGKKGPLVYPEMLVPAASTDIVAQQSGTSMKLSFVLPFKDQAGRNLSNLAGITILKRDAQADQPLMCSACTDDFTMFRRLNLDLLPPGTQRNGSLITTLDWDVQPGRSYTYIVTAFAKNDVSGAQSAPTVSIMVVPPAPPVLQAISQPTEINLEFVGLPNSAGALAGYNVYRTVKGEVFSLWPLHRLPLTANRFSDVGMERGVTYVYAVRTVLRTPKGALVESGMSNEVEGKLKDDE